MRYSKNPFFLLSLFVIMTSSIGCRKDPPEAVLPDEVALGESIVYLNGEEADYMPYFRYQSTNRVMAYAFVQTKNQGQLENLLGFSYLPYKTGEFELTTENILFVKANTYFGQTVGEDSDGYEYKLIDEEEGFFHVEEMDTVQLTVKGRFTAKFCRTSRNSNRNLGLPKVLLFQGVFYEPYTIH